MDERQYIDVSDLTRLRNATGCLRDIVPESQPVIPKEELIEVRKKLYQWIDVLQKKINLNDSRPSATPPDMEMVWGEIDAKFIQLKRVPGTTARIAFEETYRILTEK